MPSVKDLERNTAASTKSMTASRPTNVDRVLLKDADIRELAHTTVLRQHHLNATSLVIDELGLKNGKTRVDIALLNGSFHAFEIKGDTDKLARLRTQAEDYSSVFNKATLIVTEQHYPKALSHIPDWWRVMLAVRDSSGKPRLRLIRKGGKNPSVESYAVAQLLWRDEVQDVLLQLGESKKALRRPRMELYFLLSQRLHLSKLQALVRTIMAKRRSWRHRQQPLLNDGLSRPTAM